MDTFFISLTLLLGTYYVFWIRKRLLINQDINYRRYWTNAIFTLLIPPAFLILSLFATSLASFKGLCPAANGIPKACTISQYSGSYFTLAVLIAVPFLVYFTMVTTISFWDGWRRVHKKGK